MDITTKLNDNGEIHFTKNTPPEYVRSIILLKGSAPFLQKMAILFANFGLGGIHRSFFHCGQNQLYTFCTESQFLEILNKYFFIECLRDGTVKELNSYKDLSYIDKEAEATIYDYSYSEEELLKKSEEKALFFWQNSVLHDNVQIPNYSLTFERVKLDKFIS